MRVALLIALTAACGTVSPLTSEHESIAILLPFCDDLQCDVISQWSYSDNGIPVFRAFCQVNDPPDATCNDLGCLTRDVGVECKFRE